MRITRKAEYAIRLMLDLAMQEGNFPIQTKSVAQRQDIPPQFLAHIVLDLTRAGLVHSARGNQGGLSLARKAKDLTIRQIVEAIEGPIALNQCLVSEDACPRQRGCPVFDMWSEAQRRMLSVLEQTTLEYLVSAKSGKQQINDWLGDEMAEAH